MIVVGSRLSRSIGIPSITVSFFIMVIVMFKNVKLLIYNRLVDRCVCSILISSVGICLMGESSLSVRWVQWGQVIVCDDIGV